MIVKKLCNRDPHQFFQRLETLARSGTFPFHSPPILSLPLSPSLSPSLSLSLPFSLSLHLTNLSLSLYLSFPFSREYLLEVKVRLLEQLSCGFNSPQLAIEFIQMLLEEYSNLCKSLPSLLYLLEPLVSTWFCTCIQCG